MSAPVSVGVIGMKALARDVTKLCADAGPMNAALRQVGLEVAQPVAALTRSSVPQVSGRLAGDVRATASRSGAAVRMGRASLRYAGWVEFGGHRRAPHESTRPYQPRGRYLFPAALQLAQTSAEAYARGTNAALERFGWTNTTTDGGAVHD